jgi:UDP-N-acetylglucosamine 2-epimerase
VTTERGSAREQIDHLLAAIETSGIRAVFTKANTDLEGNLINRRLANFCGSNPARFRLFDNLGQTRYLSCLRSLDLMIGNSSSGLIEAPSFGLPVVNVGVRQKGRTRAGNVIDVGNGVEQVREGISKALSASFKKSLEGLVNPYDRFGDGMTSRRIKNTLKQIPSSKSLTKKEFRDLV